jgi:hypothetical protein
MEGRRQEMINLITSRSRSKSLDRLTGTVAPVMDQCCASMPCPPLHVLLTALCQRLVRSSVCIGEKRQSSGPLVNLYPRMHLCR